jgi:pilus assembly protein CpaB
LRRQSIIALVAAIFFGLIAVLLVNAYLTGADRQVAQVKTTGTIKLAVAAVPLPFGTPITPEKARLVDWPTDSVPPGAVQNMADLSQGGQPRVVLRPIEPGEPILNSKISGEGGRATLSAILPGDKRAVSIRISDVAGVAGFALPGDRVDVILTHADGPSQVADVILQDIRVIAIDQDPNEQAANPRLGRTATLEVEPFDGQKLALASQVGTLSLALRSAKAEAGSNYSARVGPGDLGGGFGSPRSSPVSLPNYSMPPLRIRPMVRPAPRPAGSNVEIVRGTTGTKYEVGPYGGK